MKLLCAPRHPPDAFAARLAVVMQAGLAAVAGIAHAQQIRIDPPTPVLAGDIRAITIEGLRPGAAVELQARRPVRDFSGTRLYASQARWQAGADGRGRPGARRAAAGQQLAGGRPARPVLVDDAVRHRRPKAGRPPKPSSRFASTMGRRCASACGCSLRCPS
jgi:hypothetical protein